MQICAVGIEQTRYIQHWLYTENGLSGPSNVNTAVAAQCRSDCGGIQTNNNGHKVSNKTFETHHSATSSTHIQTAAHAVQVKCYARWYAGDRRWKAKKKKTKSKGVFMKMTLVRRVEKKNCRLSVACLCVSLLRQNKKKTELQSYSAIYLVNSLNVGSISNVTTSTKSPTFKWLCVL